MTAFQARIIPDRPTRKCRNVIHSFHFRLPGLLLEERLEKLQKTVESKCDNRLPVRMITGVVRIFLDTICFVLLLFILSDAREPFFNKGEGVNIKNQNFIM